MKPEEIEARLKVFEDKITALTTENAQLKSDKEAAEKAKTDLEAQQFADKKKANVAALKSFCDEQVKAGKMTPAQRDALVADGKVTFADDGQVVVSLETFKAHVELAEKVLDKKQYAKTGDDKKDTFSDVQEEMDHRVKKFMADKGEKDYMVAFEAVCDTDPELAKRYNKDYATQ